MIKFGNGYYLLYLGIFIAIVIGLYFILGKCDKNKRYVILLSISFFSLTIHFLKLTLPQYSSYFPISIRKVTPENICAVSTLVFPFIFMSKNKYLKDYMFYMGIISGLASLILPLEVYGKNPFDLETIRFYLCHMSIFIVPFFMVLFGFHQLELKRVFYFPLIFIGVECLILVNEIILIESGYVEPRSSDFLNYNYRNSNFIFGPTNELKEASKYLVDWLVPKPFREVMVGEYAGKIKYTPVLWLVVPVFFYFPLLYVIIYFIFKKLLERVKC